MSLEKRILNIVDLGLIDYFKSYKLQEELVELREQDKISDTLLIAQHPFEINFGSNKKDNLLNDFYQKELISIHGDNYGYDDIKKYLESKNIKFSVSKRGGGATVLAPGQLVFYPIVDLKKLFNTNDTVSKLDVYKNLIDKVMYDALKNNGLSEVYIAKGYNKELGRDRRDVWVDIDDKHYKIGSKGIVMTKNIAYHGFVLYLDKVGTKNFDIVKPCGYDHDEVSVISVEEVLNKKLCLDKVKNDVINSIKRQFNYDEISKANKYL